MALHLPTFFIRLGSAVIYSFLMLTALLWNPEFFILFFVLINILCLHEYLNIIALIFNTSYTYSTKFIYILIGTLLFSLAIISVHPEWNKSIRIVIYILLSIGCIFLFINIKKYWVETIVGFAYITLAFICLFFLRMQSSIIPVAIVILIWTNDTMAYLTGSFIGKTKFVPTISPKKTIEGTIGGITFTLVIALIWGYYMPSLQLIHWFAIALIAAVAGTIGDLIESQLKRWAGIKDSGKLMPGHGGALDRFDSLLIAVPITYLYSQLFI